jgi:hypothetical protein
VITYNDGTFTVNETGIATPTVPPTVSAVTSGSTGNAGNGGYDNSDSGDTADGGNAGSPRSGHGADNVRPLNPCLSSAAQDTLPGPSAGFRDIEISPELAATLPFYKIPTHGYSALSLSCGQNAAPLAGN